MHGGYFHHQTKLTNVFAFARAALHLDEETAVADTSAASTIGVTTAAASDSSNHPAASAASIVASHERMISPSIMAKYLQDELRASEIKHCDTCLCGTRDLTVLADTSARTYTVGTQTQLQGDTNNALCLRCNSNLNSPSRNNSPYIMKLIRSNDSVVSDTKSSISRGGGGANIDLITDGGRMDLDKMYGGGSGADGTGKRDDLTVNPILGHHRLCDRTQQKLAAACVELQIENEITLARQNRTDTKTLSSPMQLHKTTATTTLTTTAAKQLHPHLVDLMETKTAARNSPGEHKMGNLITTTNTDTATGSTNSLWSKTSSNATNNTNNHQSSGGAVGAKMFETFNRNLIKSIKVSVFSLQTYNLGF